MRQQYATNQLPQVLLSIILFFVALLLRPTMSHAADFSPTVYTAMPYETRGTSVYNLDIGAKSAYKNSPMFNYSTVDVQGYSVSRLMDSMRGVIDANPDAPFYIFDIAGHGGPSGYLAGAGFDRSQAVAAVTQVLQEKDKMGGTIIDACYSGGAQCDDLFTRMQNGENNMFLFTGDNQINWTPTATTKLSRVFSDAASFDAADTNKDGMITAKEWANAAGLVEGKTSKVWNDEIPVVFKNPAVLKEYMEKTSKYCPVVTPGQSNGKDTGPEGTLPNYGPILSDEPDQKESELNRWLRTAASNSGKGYDTLKANIEKDEKSIKDKIKKWIIPSESQAQEFKSSNGKSYTVQGKKIQPGPYRVNQQVTLPDGGEKVFFDADCNLKPSKDPNKNNANNGANNNNNGNNGNSGGGNQGNNPQNSLSNKLADALKSLLGGNQQQNQQQNTTACGNEYSPVCGTDGKTYPNQCVAVNQNKVNVQKFGACDTQATICPSTNQPVCGTDGKTYPNRCTAETINKVVVIKEGTCTTASSSLIASTNTLSTLLKYASTSGVPDSVLSNIIRTLTNLITGFLSNDGNTEIAVP